jgi:hypothetical protein
MGPAPLLAAPTSGITAAVSLHLDAFKQEFSRLKADEYLNYCKQMTDQVRSIQDHSARDEALTALLKVIRWFNDRGIAESEVRGALDTIEMILRAL